MQERAGVLRCGARRPGQYVPRTEGLRRAPGPRFRLNLFVRKSKEKLVQQNISLLFLRFSFFLRVAMEATSRSTAPGPPAAAAAAKAGPTRGGHFTCRQCGQEWHYDFFGHKPPFAPLLVYAPRSLPPPSMAGAMRPVVACTCEALMMGGGAPPCSGSWRRPM
jgi:hypothetical protein